MHHPLTFEVADQSMIYFKSDRPESCAVPYTLWKSTRFPNHHVMVLACAVPKHARKPYRKLAVREFCGTRNIDPKELNQTPSGPTLVVKFLGE